MLRGIGGIIRVRAQVRCGRPKSHSFRLLFVTSGAPSGRGVHSASNGFTQVSLEVLGFIWVRFGASTILRVHSGSRGSICKLLKAARFIPFRVASFGRT